MPEDQGQSPIINRPGVSGVAGVLGEKLQWKNDDLKDFLSYSFFCLTKFLALTSAGRGSDTAYLDASYQIKHPSGYIFQYGKPTKTSTRTKQKNPLKFYPFRENKNLCMSSHRFVFE